MSYPRDLIGYGAQPPQAQWPGQARIALQFVLNYEEGGENSVLHGDAGSASNSSPRCSTPPALPGAAPEHGGHLRIRQRAWACGAFLREFERRGLPLTVFGVGMALERHPELTRALSKLGHEIACHGWRWISYQNLDEATEREHLQHRHGDHHGHDSASGPAGLVHRPRQPEHPAPGGGPRRLRVRQRLLRRRPALLAEVCARSGGSRGPAPGGALHPGLQRHALCAAARVSAMATSSSHYLRDSL